MRRAIVILILMAAVMAGSSKNAQTAPDIWGATIMKQPSDTQPFQQINIPEWVQDLRSITYCFSANGVYGPTWDWRRDAAKAGAQMSEMAFISQETGALYDSQLIKGRDPRWQEYLQKEIPAYKKMGVKILAGFPPGLMGECYYAHPDWRMITENTTTIPSADPIKDPGGGGLCEMGPWGDYMIEILAEMATKYPDIAAFTFDGICHRTACYCQHCRVAYRKDTGLEIPNRDMSDSSYRHYLHWLDRRMESVIQRMQTRLKGINPKLSVITWTTNAGRYGHLMSVPRNMPARMNLLFDAPDQEFWMDETNRGNTVVAAFGNAYMWAVSNHRVAFSNPYMMTHGNPYGQDSLTAEETMRRHLLVLTFGPRPNAGIAGSTTYVHTVFKMMGEVEKRWPWCKKREFEPWAAMVMSDNTNTFYGRDGRTEERYLANVLGTFRAGLESHLPLTVINDWNLTPQDLAKFKVLVLPNTAVMGDAQAEAVRQFVKNGGGLVASMDTSLFDEFGDPRKDFLLNDLFGAHYQGTAMGSGKREAIDVNFEKAIDPMYWEKRKGIFDFKLTEHPIFDSQKMKDYLPDGSSLFKGAAVSVSANPGVQAIGTITPREEGAKALPSVLVQSYGKGKVVYLAAGFDSAYYLYPFPYYRLLLARAMRWAAAEQPRIQVDAPMCVYSTFYRQKTQGERLVVNLFNNANTESNHAKPDDDVPLRDEILPIHDIKVAFKDYNISRIHLEPEGIDLKVTRDGNTCQVTLPPLSIHSMVVAELGQTSRRPTTTKRISRGKK